MFNKSHLLTLILVLFSIFSSKAQQNQWLETSENQLNTKEKMQRGNNPSIYKLFKVNLTTLTQTLLEAPEDTSGQASNTFVKFPDAQGNISEFEIYNSPMMEKELALQANGIHNFTGINKKDPTNIIKISVTPAFGMHIMGFDGAGTTYYVDTYTTDFNSYIFYKRNDIENTYSSFQCLVDQNNEESVENIGTLDYQTLSSDNKFRSYRLAMACTIEYAAFHVNAAPNTVPKNTVDQKKDIVLAAMNVTVNRLNAIYERDLSVRLILVANNKNIIFITSDNFSNNDADALIDQSQSVITSTIGSANFDFGHTVSTGGGGLATKAYCASYLKASGITGSPSPVGDPFDIDYVAHEVGHQFGANHTFNGTTGSCGGGNINLPTAVEPGSGSTIMAYAGICGNNINVQQNSDAYFHQASITEIISFLTSGYNNCATVVSQNNPTPNITTQGNKTIPYGTPFILTATGSDSNNPNSLTYTWEQSNVNQSSTQPPVATSIQGPNFRSLAPTAKSTRSFPAEATVLAGTTNSNGVVSSKWEVLPTVQRSMKFTATVRDNNAIGGGQTKSSDATITFANAGPFVITYPNNRTNTAAVAWAFGTQKTVTWNVAGTIANGINTSNVNILFSSDNGVTYSTLAANVPNNGSATITVPTLNTSSTQCRIKIEAVGNIFYTVSKAFSVTTAAASEDFNFDNFSLYPNPTSDVVTINFNSATGTNVNIEIFDIRGRKLNTQTIENFGTINAEINFSNFDSGVYLIKIQDGDNQSTKKVIKK